MVLVIIATHLLANVRLAVSLTTIVRKESSVMAIVCAKIVVMMAPHAPPTRTVKVRAVYLVAETCTIVPPISIVSMDNALPPVTSTMIHAQSIHSVTACSVNLDAEPMPTVQVASLAMQRVAVWHLALVTRVP